MSAGGKRKGAGRKSVPARVAITIRVDAYTASRFRLYCNLTKLSHSKAIERFVREAKI
jgi:hypothetical protein